MSGLKTKILIYKVLSVALLLFAIAAIVFFPSITIEWEKETFGITEEYYTNISFDEWIYGAQKQIHLKNADDLGVKQENIDSLLGKIDIYKDVKGIDYYSPTKEDRMSNMVLLLLVPALMYGALIIVRNKGRKKECPRLEMLAAENKLDKKTERTFFSVLFGIDTRAWITSFWLSLLCVCSWFYFNKDLEVVELYNSKLSINCIYYVAVLVVIGILQQLLSNSIRKEIKANHITSRAEIYGTKVTAAAAAQAPANVSSEAETPTDASAEEEKNASALLEYKKLLDAGAITQEEFDQKKKELLGL